MSRSPAQHVARRTQAALFALAASGLLAGAARSRSFGVEWWDAEFDGVDSAADNVPNHLRWDSAIADDLVAVQQNFGGTPGGAGGTGVPVPGALGGLVLSALIASVRRRGSGQVTRTAPAGHRQPREIS